MVTATRDSDGKMCQLVDVRGLKNMDHKGNKKQYGFAHGFKEIGGDTCKAGISVAVVEGELDAYCYFSPNTTSGGVKALCAKETEEPDAFDTFLDSGGYESTGVLTLLSITFEPPGGRRLFSENNMSPQAVVRALNKLEWF